MPHAFVSTELFIPVDHGAFHCPRRGLCLHLDKSNDTPQLKHQRVSIRNPSMGSGRMFIDLSDTREGQLNCIDLSRRSERQLDSVPCRRRPVHDGSSGSEEMNDNLDSLLVSKIQKHRQKINYISNRDLVRLYEASSFPSPSFDSVKS